MLRTENITRRFGSFSLKNISIDIQEGEYYVLLGRSGAGKSLLLEMLCGLTLPQSGKIYLEGLDITNARIQNRNLGLVFQDYALFPNMCVEENIAFPLKVRKMKAEDIKTKVVSISKAMNISHLLRRHPDQLSGGEKQRVAIARTLITSPKVLLLDEPLASVDAIIKDDVCRLLRSLNRNGQTIIHVTHDFEEALSLASRIGVLHNGRIIQEGSPVDVFEHPVDKFVARYTGIKNFFRVSFVMENGARVGITENGNRIITDGGKYPEKGLLIIRNDDCRLSCQRIDADNSLQGIIEEIIPSQAGFEVAVNARDYIFATVSRNEMESQQLKEGDKIWVNFASEDIKYLPDSEL